ncbi:MAG: transposase, partial [Clostridiales bacterium]|nr:transposase [Clostridiales bacterium]
YTPIAINRFKETVENIPLRHFVWNIAERLLLFRRNSRILFIHLLKKDC